MKNLISTLDKKTKKLREVEQSNTEFKLNYDEDFLSDVDVIAAKAKYAYKINGILPNIIEEKRLFFREAFHPILYLNNKEKKAVTYPQTIELHNESRIIVISGPNAGGKTISLKTVGLLQLMLQSGILIPVHERSETFLFDRILTDIGDNQSIENHLSTYSYRLKNMNFFLKKCNDKTLFLIDEFGTGSDPELGGALAETFLEEFYAREAFGIITTHYSNLKILANELPFASNANMMFDEKSLEPMYKLILGQAGSSFTFEVAQKNGIPFGLINRAKKKIEGGKVRFDKTIATLQKERSKLEKTSLNLKEEETKAREESKKMETINAKIQDKLERYQELYDANQRLIYMGQKIDDIAEKYFNNKDKKTLIGEFLKVVEIENSKRKKISAKEKKIKEVVVKQVIAEVNVKVEEIRTEKKENKIKAKLVPEKPDVILKVGDRVRMKDGKAIGTIEKIEKNKVSVNYGVFISKTNLESLKNKELINYNEFTNDITTIKLTDKGNSFIHIMKVENQIEKIQSNSMQFDELLELYPKKTPKGRALQAGYRLNREKWSKMYFANLKKSGFTHEQVIDAVKNEIKSRTINNTLEYLSMLPTYINQGKWDSYISTVVNPVQYGDDFK